ncbi:hypothetical protein [Desulfovirgula thermocuniculi]|uniref:hypothetical protein n=1 Tax=Desulfovirgula thermocuniculi TaxID=348842 RepID=UPI001B7F977E|nr:hypothetical protein [Desulfovirgula thermocuniculi]
MAVKRSLTALWVSTTVSREETTSWFIADRLARFGYAYLERHLNHCGVEIEVTSQKEPDDAHAELVQDLLAIVTSFSARLYGESLGRKVRQGFRELIEDAEKARREQV